MANEANVLTGFIKYKHSSIVDTAARTESHAGLWGLADICRCQNIGQYQGDAPGSAGRELQAEDQQTRKETSSKF